MQKRITLRVVALVMLMMLASVPVNAAVRFHVFVGPRAYPAYPYGYTYPYYPYANYYVAPANRYYSYPYYYTQPDYGSGYSYSYRWHRRHEWREHRDHEFREHHRR